MVRDYQLFKTELKDNPNVVVGEALFIGVAAIAIQSNSLRISDADTEHPL